MPPYTFFMQFREGTYISQVEADDPNRAKNAWARQLDIKAIWGMGASTKGALIDAVERDTPSPIDGNPGVWCIYIAPLGHPCMVHFVQTDRRPGSKFGQPGKR